MCKQYCKPVTKCHTIATAHLVCATINSTSNIQTVTTTSGAAARERDAGWEDEE